MKAKTRTPGPTWLADYLISAGHMTETGTTRRARIRRCPCGADVLVGLDDIVGAFEVKVDPVPLSELGEVLALLEGRRTLALNREGGGFVVNMRDQWAIARRPAGTGSREDVLRQHECSTPAPAGAAVAASTFAEAKPRQPANTTPDF